MAQGIEIKQGVERIAFEPGKFATADGMEMTAGSEGGLLTIWHTYPPPDPDVPGNVQDHQLEAGDKVIVVDHGTGLTVKIIPA